MTTPSITDLLKHADLQMAAEAFLTSETPPHQLLTAEDELIRALTRGNGHASKFTELQAADFLANWEVVAQQPNTETDDQPLAAWAHRWQKHAARIKHTLTWALLGTAVVALSACAGGSSASSRGIDKTRQETAIAMWKERCQKAGEFIHETVEDVEGVYLMKLRPKVPNFADQFGLDDPYGRDSGGEGLIEGFLKHKQPAGANNIYPEVVFSNEGYRYVVASNPEDRKLYQYEGQMIEPWQTDKKYLKGYLRFVLVKTPANEPLPRYGITWEDLSTKEEREYWITGSSLKVIDLQTNKVIAERVGYMVDWAQGSRVGNRSPWLFAADTACPMFANPGDRRQPEFSAQPGQTYRFVSKVLKPKQ